MQAEPEGVRAHNEKWAVRSAIVVALSTLVLLVLAGCEYPGVPHPLAARVENSGFPTPSPAPATTPVGTPDKQPGEPLQEGTIHVSLQDFRLDPDHMTVKTGTVTFVLENTGRYTHDFRVEGQGTDERAPKVGQGRTFEWLVVLSPGNYQVSCPISNHANRGMIGTLEVLP